MAADSLARTGRADHVRCEWLANRSRPFALVQYVDVTGLRGMESYKPACRGIECGLNSKKVERWRWPVAHEVPTGNRNPNPCWAARFRS